jgi:hypothetical protein
MTVQHTRTLRPFDQLRLFHVRQIGPHWTDLPREVRELTLKLLVQLIRQHHRDVRGRGRGRQVRDE